MKREIKFRAWDSLKNRWYEPTFEGYRGKIEEIMLSPRGRLTMRTMTESIDESMFPNRFELMQYTGLKDKNGREIYEGDILKVTSEDGESYVAVVKWFGDDGYPAFDLAGIPTPFSYDANALATIFQEGVEMCEVIGNIFEDKQLLEGKQ
ncbi:YopX family protein [Lacticaseibacillus paracasei]|uniref:YopX family protein n=1 Tax=Lacticaseibacillus paracasei TaxID=1597 RepID=UPI0021A912BD|nr:YopX family protein [Lacticaseibacillus paracasei]MCT2893684.1 hypothetical protein [Lacticaseibacillus paracasei]